MIVYEGRRWYNIFLKQIYEMYIRICIRKDKLIHSFAVFSRADARSVRFDNIIHELRYCIESGDKVGEVESQKELVKFYRDECLVFDDCVMLMQLYHELVSNNTSSFTTLIGRDFSQKEKDVYYDGVLKVRYNS